MRMHTNPGLSYHIGIVVDRAPGGLVFIKCNTNALTLFFASVVYTLPWFGYFLNMALLWRPYFSKDLLDHERVQNIFYTLAHYSLKLLVSRLEYSHSPEFLNVYLLWNFVAFFFWSQFNKFPFTGFSWRSWFPFS